MSVSTTSSTFEKATSQAPTLAPSPTVELWTEIDDDFILAKIKEVALGIFASIATLFIQIKTSPLIENFVFTELRKRGIHVAQHVSDIACLLKSLNNLPYATLRSILKVALIGHLSLLKPVIEEYYFRTRLYGYLQSKQTDPNSLFSRVCRVFFNAFIFGFYHFSPFQGWANIPIISTTFLIGLIFATLKEATGGIVSSSSCNILHHSFISYPLL